MQRCKVESFQVERAVQGPPKLGRVPPRPPRKSRPPDDIEPQLRVISTGPITAQLPIRGLSAVRLHGKLMVRQSFSWHVSQPELSGREVYTLSQNPPHPAFNCLKQSWPGKLNPAGSKISVANDVRRSIQRGSYYRDNRHSPALVRARRPYLVKNTLWGLGLCAFTLGICTSSWPSPTPTSSDLLPPTTNTTDMRTPLSRYLHHQRRWARRVCRCQGP